MNARVVTLCCVALVGWSCKTPAPPPSGELVDSTHASPRTPASLAAADAALREQLRLSQLGMIPEDAQRSEDVLAGMIRWKSRSVMTATTPFEAALTRNADPDVAEFALLRLAVAYLNLGCETAALQPPRQLSDSQQGIINDVLDRSAFASIERTREFLELAAGYEGRRQPLIERLRDALPQDEGRVDEACAQSSTAWAAPDPATLTEVTQRGCDEGEGVLCWVWAKWGGGPPDALSRACDLEVPAACLDAADRSIVALGPSVGPDHASAAERLYARACALGSSEGCRKEVAVFVPSSVETYRDACVTRGDAVACLKLARTLTLDEANKPLWWACTSAQARPTALEAATQCAANDAFGCAVRAGGLQVDPRYIVRVEEPAAADLSRATLACSEGRSTECAAGARAFARAGDWGCATALMTEACARGDTALCGFAEVD